MIAPGMQAPAIATFRQALGQLIGFAPDEWQVLEEGCFVRHYCKKDLLVQPGRVCDETFFVVRGLIRVLVTDTAGSEHTVHFALENQFIAEYSSFLQRVPAHYTLQALEDTEVVVMPRPVVEWGYRHLQEGQKLGRLIAEFYFLYLDNRIKNLYVKTPLERYEGLSKIFPGIHNRVPQHMLASYLGITPVHLSRLKKEAAGH
ncbi:MAG: Crp/Fnr family transcriptional regulator [Bacteroidia bacterium]